MGDNTKGFEFKKFATPRIIGGIVIVVIILWALSAIFTYPEGQSSRSRSARQHDSAATTDHAAGAGKSDTTPGERPSTASGAATGHTVATADTAHETASAAHGSADSHGAPVTRESSDSRAAATHDAPAATQPGLATHAERDAQQTGGRHATTAAGQSDPHATPAKAADTAAHRRSEATTQHRTQASGGRHTAKTADHPPAEKPAGPAASQHGAQAGAGGHGTATGHAPTTSAVDTPVHKPTPKGVAFVKAAMQPLSYELEERWWGWRPNDIIEFTDNVNTFQLGVLEVTRRTTVALAERISRTGTTDAFDENLEQAMNWFMVKASSYWFPSAESKYREGIEELQAYLDKLMAGNATFYTRTDNLIPLLASFEDLMGSCDENLVKEKNEDGTPISAFAVDNYFFYTQGVASAMATVLEAVHHDFLLTLEQRNATELLHHAIISCQRAAELDPWIVLDRNLSSIFANHRANMAAPISHARFYLGQLITTLST